MTCTPDLLQIVAILYDAIQVSTRSKKGPEIAALRSDQYNWFSSKFYDLAGVIRKIRDGSHFYSLNVRFRCFWGIQEGKDRIKQAAQPSNETASEDVVQKLPAIHGHLLLHLFAA
jgi:hypothetical protein